MMIRIGGLIGMIFGTALTFLIFWLAQKFHAIPLRLAILGPLIVGISLGVVIFGKGIIRSEDEESFSFLGLIFVALGGIVGFFMVEAYKKGDMRWFEKSKVAIAETVGLREGRITQEDVTSAVQAVNARAAELQKRRLTVDVKNAEQMKQYEADAAAYTEENRRVRELVSKFEGQRKNESDLKAKLVGTWSFEYTVKKRGSDLIEIRGNAVYSANGSAHVDGVNTSGGKSNAFSTSGTWKVEGDILTYTLLQGSGHTLSKAGDVFEFQILKIDANEFQYRDLKDGAELVRTRVL